MVDRKHNEKVKILDLMLQTTLGDRIKHVYYNREGEAITLKEGEEM